jgi:hypothetical protein
MKRNENLSLKKMQKIKYDYFCMLFGEEIVTEIYKNDQNALTKTQFYARSHLRLVQTVILTLHVCTMHQQYQSTIYFSTMMHTIIKSQEY